MADEAWAGRHDDLAITTGATDVHTFASAGGSFKENFFNAADEGLITGEGVFTEDIDEYLVAFFFDFDGDGVAQRFGSGAGAYAVFEEVGHIEPDVVEVLAGQLKVLLGLSGEANDYVGGNVDPRANFADAVDDAAKALHRVGAAHGLEDAVAAALHREVEVLAEFG